MKDINLLPEEERQIPQPSQEKVKIQFKLNIKSKTIGIGVAIAVIAIGLLAAPKIYVKVQNIRLDNIKREMASSKYTEVNALNSELATVSAALTTKQSVIDTIDKQTYSVNEIIQSLRNSLPSGVSITNLTYDTATLSINIKSSDINKVAEFLLNINRLSFLTLEGGDSLEVTKDGSTTLNFKIGSKGGN